MSNFLSFKSFDGISLDIKFTTPKNPKALLIVWPCTMGDVRMYKFPSDLFILKEYSSILFNPRGHGKSGGAFNTHTAVKDLEGILYKFNDKNLPIISIGHSGGCSGLLKLSSIVKTSQFYLISPVFNSRKSLFYMYQNKTITEFNQMLAIGADDPQTLLSVLDNDNWLCPNHWRKNKLKQFINNISGRFKIGSFLEMLFIEGVDTYSELQINANLVELLLPQSDNWYPLESTLAFAQKNDIVINNSLGAKDHYFTRSWQSVWKYILDSI